MSLLPTSSSIRGGLAGPMTTASINITIRFTSSLPDLPLILTPLEPFRLTTLALIQRIRSAIPEPYASARIRLIHGGRVLAPTSSVGSQLRLPEPKPAGKGKERLRATFRPTGDSRRDRAENERKGKEPVRPYEQSDGARNTAGSVDEGRNFNGGDEERAEVLEKTSWSTGCNEDSSNVSQSAPIYVHASFGDALSPAELAAEAETSRRSLTLRPPWQRRQRNRNLSSSPSPNLSVSTSRSRRNLSPSSLGSSAFDHSRGQGPSNLDDEGDLGSDDDYEYGNDGASGEGDEQHIHSGSQSPTSSSSSPPSTPPPPPPPQGFDRLLAAGLSAVEVAALRSQFVAILAHTRTPDSMPSAAELRVLEERWLDDGATAGAAATTTSGGDDPATDLALANGLTGVGGGLAAADDDMGAGGSGGGLEDMLWGNVMGFFWPIGAVVWLLREEGVWSKRRQVAVLTGFLVNLAISFLRETG